MIDYIREQVQLFVDHFLSISFENAKMEFFKHVFAENFSKLFAREEGTSLKLFFYFWYFGYISDLIGLEETEISCSEGRTYAIARHELVFIK